MGCHPSPSIFLNSLNSLSHPPFMTTCVGELEDETDVFVAHIYCRKMTPVMPFICSKYGGLRTIKGSSLADILRGCIGYLRSEMARYGILCGYVFPGRRQDRTGPRMATHDRNMAGCREEGALLPPLPLTLPSGKTKGRFRRSRLQERENEYLKTYYANQRFNYAHHVCDYMLSWPSWLGRQTHRV